MHRPPSRSLFDTLFATYWGYIAVALIFGGLVVATFKLSEPYSYWLDELFSVTASGQPVTGLHEILLADDVHPPLYYLVLKAWMSLFGDGEFATRALSWFFSMAALLALARFCMRYGHVFLITATAFLASNTLFIYQANESRAYAMVLFLATLVVTNYPRSPQRCLNWPFALSCVLLSLTHYFGLIFVAIVIATCLWRNFHDRATVLRLATLATVCVSWLIYHGWAGQLLAKTGGHFWIKVNGVFQSLELAVSGFVPIYNGMGPYFAASLMMFLILIARWHAQKMRDERSALIFEASAVTLAMVVGIALIDLWTPVSTRKNYIVLLPLICLLVGSASSIIVTRYPKLAGAALLSVFTLCAISLQVAHSEITLKSQSKQNWKDASRFMAMHAEGMHLYHTTEQEGFIMRRLIAQHYLAKTSHGQLTSTDYVAGQTTLKRPALILFGHDHASAHPLLSEMTRLNAQQLFEGYDPNLYGSRAASVGVFRVD